MLITELKENEIFVFGSNLNGFHGGGAAKLAHEKFDALWGQVEGLQGQSYAIPTLDENMYKIRLQKIRQSLLLLVYIAKKFPGNTFYLTDIGCGIAGYFIEELESILPKLPDNIIPTWK